MAVFPANCSAKNYPCNLTILLRKLQIVAPILRQPMGHKRYILPMFHQIKHRIEKIFDQ